MGEDQAETVRKKKTVVGFADAISDTRRPFLKIALSQGAVPRTVTPVVASTVSVSYSEELILLSQMNDRVRLRNPEESYLYGKLRAEVVREIRAAPEHYLDRLSEWERRPGEDSAFYVGLLFDASAGQERPLIEARDLVGRLPYGLIRAPDSSLIRGQLIDWVVRTYGTEQAEELFASDEKFRSIEGIEDSLASRLPASFRRLAHQGYLPGSTQY